MNVTNLTAGPILLGDGASIEAGGTREYAAGKLSDRDQRRVDRGELAIAASPAKAESPAKTEDETKGKAK